MAVENAKSNNPIDTIYLPDSPKKPLVNAKAVRLA
jgi:hypothetical protein